MQANSEKSATLAAAEERARLDRERIQLALDAGAIIGTWVWDVPGDRFTVDEAFADAFGLDPDLGREGLSLERIMSTVHPDDRSGLTQAIEAALARGGRYAHQYRVCRRDGQYHWIEANGRVDLEGGKAVRFSGVLLGIGERRRIETERDRAESLLRTFAEAVPGVVYAKDRQGRLLIGNRGTTELIGKAPEDYLGRTDAELLDDQDQAAAVRTTDERIMSSGEPEQLEEEISFPDGRKAIWLSTKAPLRDADGQVIGLVGASLDITDRREAEARHRDIEERYRLAARATNDAIWDWRMADGHVIWNEALTERFGHRVCETSAAWWIDQIHPDDRERVDASIHAAIDRGAEAWTEEYRFRRSDGSYASVLDRGAVLRATDGTAVRMIGAMLDLSERKAAEAAMRESEQRLRLAAEAADIGFWDVDLKHDLLIWPTRTRAMFGISSDAPVSLGDFFACLHPEDRDATEAAFAAAADADRRAIYDVEYRAIGREDDVVRWISAKGRGVFEDGRCGRVVGVARDVTARKTAQAQLLELNERLEQRVAQEVAERAKAEEALRQSQKMEAVGQLTGGIAHDFNNMLAVVIGSLDLLKRRIGDSDPRAQRFVEAAGEGARRAAQLTQRLLAFSRQQPLKPVALDANKLVAGMSDLLLHSLGGEVRPETVLAGGLWRIHADPNQLENVVLNLAVNARDAMKDGGRLTIETANCHLDERYASDHLGVPAGQYVLIAVSDTGTGMAPEVVARAFDPFFTTKAVGRGTGLGLSQVYGFIKQSGGHVKIYSEPGEGTTVKVYLPRFLGPADALDPPRVDQTLPCGEAEVILIVDDEPSVLRFSADALLELGYSVLEADSAAVALALIDAHPEIVLLFTDVVMPEMNGRKLAEEALKRRPDLKVLFTSGYTKNAVVHHGVLDPGVQLVSKPFTIDELASRVRRILDDVNAGPT